MSENARGALAMALAMLSFCANDTLVKLTFADLPLGQIMVIRGVFGVALALGLCAATGALHHWRRLAHPLVLARSGVEAIAASCFLAALTALPLTVLTAILQATPLIATAIAAAMIGEQVGWRRWSATCVGLIGVLIVINPFAETGVDTRFALLGLAAAVFAASRDLITRGIPKQTPTLLIAMMAVSVITVLGGAIMLGEFAIGAGPVWAPVSLSSLGLLALAALGLLGGNFFVSLAMRYGEVSVVSPVRYSVVLWAMLLSWIVFAEIPGWNATLGAAIVVAAGLYTLHRERVRKG